MRIITVLNPVYSKADNSQIDCEIATDKGVFPFTAHSQDVEEHGRSVFNDLMAGKYGDISPHQEKGIKK